MVFGVWSIFFVDEYLRVWIYMCFYLCQVLCYGGGIDWGFFDLIIFWVQSGVIYIILEV